MNKDLIKGILILAGVVLALFVGAVAATDHGVDKLGCVFRALSHGIALSNVHAVCGL
jgi:hypothetical protein